MKYITDVPNVKHKASWSQVKAAAYGQWQAILATLIPGITQKQLSGNPAPCPACGGHDRFQYVDEGRGTWHCRKCADTSRGGFPNGFSLIAAFRGISESEAKDMVGDYLGLNGMETPIPQPIKPAYQKKSFEEQTQPQAKPTRTPAEIKTIALSILANCDNGLPGYLKNKGFTTTDHAVNRCRFQLPNSKQFVPAGALVVPVQSIADLSETISVQYIPVAGKKKYHLNGFSKSDGVIVIPGNDSLPYIAIGTGYATCYAFALAMGCPTFSLFDDNNLVSNCTKIADFYCGKQVLIIGDNDSHKGHTKGQDAAREAVALIRDGIALIPPYDDWDFHLREFGIEATKAEIARQLVTVTPETFGTRVNIADNVIGLDISYLVKLKDGTKIPLRDAMLNGTGRYVCCPISGEEARINAGSIYSITEHKTIVPILTALHNKAIINECQALRTTKERARWVLKHNTKQHVYALAYVLRDRFGSSLSVQGSFERLLQNKIEIAPEIKDYIAHLFNSKVNQGRELCKLDSKQFKQNYRYLEHINGRIEWEPIANEIRASNKPIFAIQALQGSGKTEDLAKRLVGLFPNVVYITHRQKLVAQATDKLKLFHYKDDKNTIRTAGHVPHFACCTPSLNKEINLNHIKKASLIIIDEFIQWFGDLLTNDKCIKPEFDLQTRLQTAMKEALLNGCKFVLLDADLTNKGIHQFKRFLDVQLDDILLIEAQERQRDLTADISFSTAPRHYQTYGVKLIEDDLANNRPFLVAMESSNSAQAMFDKALEMKPDKHIVLLIGGKCLVHKDGFTTYRKTTDFIDNINNKLSDVDALIYTSLVGTGVSITHADKRFKKCYGFFSGWTCSAMDAIQMIKRGRDVTEYVLCVLDRPHDYMGSFYKDIGAESWSKLIDENNDIDTLTYEVKHNKRQNSALFGSCLIGLLRNKHRMKMNGQLSIEDKTEGLASNTMVRDGMQDALMSATPHPDLKHAQARQMDEYNNDEERFSCEARICLDYFKISTVTSAAAEILCNPAKREAANRLELIVKLNRRDPDLILKGAEKRLEILIDSGITLDLLNNQRLTQEDIKNLRDNIDRNRGALFGMGLLPERYSKKIPSKSPIKPVIKILEYIGLNTETIRTGEAGTEYELDISVPSPMVSRLSIDIRTEKEKQKEKALKLQNDGFGYGHIAKELGLKNRFHARRLLET